MTTNTYLPDEITALYARLSQEDSLDGDSSSIVDQKAILLKYAQDNHFPNPTFFIDDGVSGVTFDREGFNQMVAAIEAGRAKTVIVKDMSRLGRDYLKVGYYTEIFFAEKDVRYIAINESDRQGFFSGLVFCSDCGSKLHFATCKRFDQTQDHYRCSNYKSNTGSCTAHFMTANLSMLQVLFHAYARQAWRN